MTQKSQFVTENTPKNKDKLEKQLKGVKNSAKTQGFTEKRKILLKTEHKAYNKRLRQRYLHSAQLTFDDYVNYIEGYYRIPTQTESVKRYSAPKVRETEEIPSLSTFKESSTGVDWLKHKEKLEISKQYTVVPAYNKGPYMVVPVEELHTAGKKV
tara:strand:+ start:606 stop:1070 length:465 start_codon:yes stop_codon:yes gene_type:complete